MNPSRLNLALKMAILTSGYSQTDIAELTKIAESRLSRIVRNRDDASDDEKKVIARFLRRKVTDLFPERAREPRASDVNRSAGV